MKLPSSPFISLSFLYITFIIISFISTKYQNHHQKKTAEKDSIEEKKLIFNEINIIQEYGIEEGDYFLYVNLFFVVVADILEETINKFNFSFLNYWMFEMLFFEIFNSRFLKTKIYQHHIFSLIFILSSCSIIKTIVIILSFVNNINDTKIFDNSKWLIPLAIIVYFFFQIFRAFTYCYEKYYLEKRIISITNYILIYGIFGLITCSICGIISTFVPCGDNTIPDLSKIVCSMKNGEEKYYFDSYIIYFQKLLSDFFGLRLILVILKSILLYGVTYYCYIIFKKLSPICYICMYRLNNLIIDILLFINDSINKNIKKIDSSITILEILIFIFYISGSAVYLEFIEINFSYLNFNTRRNIRRRSDTEFKISIDELNMIGDVVDYASNE